ncbi:MAG: hypothetical protein VKK04_09305 [Synechococcales bacterium]|nr:hypothetical protein [Synechococcales bacterium]
MISILLGASSSVFTPADAYWVEDLPEASTLSHFVRVAAWSTPLVVNVAEQQRLEAPKVVAAQTVAPLSFLSLRLSHPKGWHSLSIALRQMRQLLWMLSRQWYALIVRGQLLFIEGYNP